MKKKITIEKLNENYSNIFLKLKEIEARSVFEKVDLPTPQNKVEEYVVYSSFWSKDGDLVIPTWREVVNHFFF